MDCASASIASPSPREAPREIEEMVAPGLLSRCGLTM